MITTLPIATISFPEINLPQRHAAQLRGFFGNYFREKSPLLHNHYADGSSRYAYPLVQYKVLNGVPVLVGLQEGAKLLTELFFQIHSLNIAGREYEVRERDISFKKMPVGMSEGLCDYRFESLWMPLNQHNYQEYLAKSPEERKAFLGRILVGNILSFYKGIGLFLPPEQRVMVALRPQEATVTGFKDNLMTAIGGEFTSNMLLPDHIGLGKSVARGYGAIQQI